MANLAPIVASGILIRPHGERHKAF